MLNKHVHALKLLVISMFIGVFTGRVYVWRLILKKKIALVIPTLQIAHISLTLFPTLHFHSYTANASRAKWDLHRLWYGLEADLKRIWSEGEGKRIYLIYLKAGAVRA